MTGSQEKCPGGFDPTLLLTYLEGGLERSLKKEVEEHLKGCPFCSEQLQIMARMDSLLSSHPEAFHPNEEELYRLVAAGEDQDGLIEDHLETCSRCRAETDALREHLFREKAVSCAEASLPAYLAAELDRAYPVESARRRTWTTLPASVGHWLADAFRRPILAMGTAAALLLVAVLVIPMWKTFKNIPHPARQSETLGSLQHVEGRVAPAKTEIKKKATIQSSESVAPLAEEPDGKEAAPHISGTPVRSFVAAPPSPSSAVPHVKGRVNDESTVRSQERAGGASPHTLPAAPEPTADMAKRERKPTGRGEISERDRRRQVEPGESTPGSASSPAQADKKTQEAVRGKVGETTRPRLNLNAPHREQVFSGSVTGGQEAPVKPRVQVTVSIVYPEGKAIPGVRFIPPQQLENRYTFLSEETGRTQPEEKPSTPTSGAPAFIQPRLRDAAASLRIDVRISESGSLFDLKADLMTAGSDIVTRRAEALGIGGQDLENRITSLVSSLLN